MYYCCGISEKGTVSHNEDALLIGKQVITEGAYEAKLKPAVYYGSFGRSVRRAFRRSSFGELPWSDKLK